MKKKLSIVILILAIGVPSFFIATNDTLKPIWQLSFLKEKTSEDTPSIFGCPAVEVPRDGFPIQTNKYDDCGVGFTNNSLITLANILLLMGVFYLVYRILAIGIARLRHS